ncbi:hypothetical protein QLX67_06405, partial [Balneolaceae bacterium ANBcel3]|nr:hypothetical protein [Balneolaceae bacterium ANBcel3]
INRMGLNNLGARTICRFLKDKKAHNTWLFDGFPTGVNIAKTHDPEIVGEKAITDYVSSYKEAINVADYITLNISCPNTREGKTFEDISALTGLLEAIREIRTSEDPPLLLKWSPDIGFSELEKRMDICEQFKLDGYVVSNTSSGRNGLQTPEETLTKIGAGGLSGAPLYPNVLKRVRFLRSILPPERVIIGCGGIDRPERALEIFRAGANLIQLYTGFVYEGPSLVSSIQKALIEEIEKENCTDFEEWLYLQWPRE